MTRRLSHGLRPLTAGRWPLAGDRSPLPARRLLVVLCLAAPALGVAVAPAAPQDSRPSISFYFRAIGPDGLPVADLKPGDVTLKVGGAPRTIRALRLTEFAKGAAETAPAPGGLPPPFATNERASGGGRDVFLVIDDLSISPGGIGMVKEALSAALGAASSRDRVGLLSVRPGGVNIGPTLEHEKISAAISALTGQRGSSDTCRAGAMVETLRNLIEESVGPVPATVAFMSSGWAGNMIGPNCAIRPDDLRTFGTTVQRANASLYFIQVVDGGSLAAWFDSAAGASGAELFRVTGTNPGAAARVVRETAALYRVTLDKETSDRNGTTARVDVRVARPNVKVYAPPGLTFAMTDSAASVAPTPALLLRSLADYADLQLRAAAYVSRDTSPDSFKIVAAFEPVDPSVKLGSASIGLFDAGGQSSARWTGRRSDFARSPVLAGFPVPPGRYRIRIAAVDAAGRAGAVDVPIVTGLAKAGPLTLSTVVLGVKQGAGFAPRLQFGGETEAVAYFEIYDLTGNTAASVRFELAGSDNGPALADVPATLERSSAGESLIVTGALPIGNLPPGDVLVRAVISLDGKPAGRAQATLRKAKP